MASFYYYDQNPFRFSFHILIWYSQWGFENKSPNFHKKAKSWRILFVVVKWRHRAKGLLSIRDSFVRAVLFIPFAVIFIFHSMQFSGSCHCLNFDKCCDTAPLNVQTFSTNSRNKRIHDTNHSGKVSLPDQHQWHLIHFAGQWRSGTIQDKIAFIIFS